MRGYPHGYLHPCFNAPATAAQSGSAARTVPQSHARMGEKSYGLTSETTPPGRSLRELTVEPECEWFSPENVQLLAVGLRVVGDAESLLRRVPPWQQSNGAAMWLNFRDPELSVDRERLRSVVDAIADGKPGSVVARLRAGTVRQAMFSVCADPVPDNISHALVHRPGLDKKAQKQAAKMLWELVESYPAAASDA